MIAALWSAFVNVVLAIPIPTTSLLKRIDSARGLQKPKAYTVVVDAVLKNHQGHWVGL
jgi:hypothetical protein